MNFARDVVAAMPPEQLALIELARDGSRREWSFGDCSERSAAIAAALSDVGVGRGDVVITMIGNRPEWVWAMVACFRCGFVALACSEQLRADDLKLRFEMTAPAAIVADERNREVLEASSPPCPIIWVDDEGVTDPARAAGAPEFAEMEGDEPCLITFTSGTTGEPKGVVHGQRYLPAQKLQAEHWLGAQPGELVWCTAATGWSKSARNVFIAPWITGAAALLHDARFDPEERLAIIEAEQVNVLCMVPTEFRVIAKRSAPRPVASLRSMVAAGEPLNPEILRAYHEATGVWIRDGYGQTETGHSIGHAPGDGEPPAGAMGKPLPGIKLWIEDDEIVLDPLSEPTFFLGYIGEGARQVDGGWEIEDRQQGGPWHSGDEAHEEDGYFYFDARADDVIISAGYRIGPFEVESALLTHPSVADVAAVAAPDEERGAVVRAVIVLREGFTASDELVTELQQYAKEQTAPYKYPRIIDFVDELPKTNSGKVRRADLRS